MIVLQSCLMLIFLVFEHHCRVVTPHPKCRNNVCYFDFVVDYKFTMMWYNYTNLREPQFNPIVFKDGILQRRVTNVACGEEFIPLTREEFKNRVTAGDGRYKLVYAINGEIPGPNIVVFEDQIVSITVHNALKIEGITIHWHGLVQRGTPWMDGADMISQCPILPGQTFEYRFVASPAGTHWYHGHVHTMRSDGLAGAFIVLPRIRPPITTPSELIPKANREFLVVIFDWMKTTAHEKFQARRGGFAVLEDYDGQCLPATLNYDGSGFLFQVHIGLINGKGQRYINDDPTLPERDYLPLETFSVKQNQYYRFRTINAGFESAFEISVDDHMLTIVAFDGNDVVPYQADIVVIQPGERVDFIIFTNRPADNYRINYLTTTIGDFSGQTFNNRRGTYAILNYQGIDKNASPIVKKRVCTPILPCLAVNQIFGLYPAGINIVSIPLTRLQATNFEIKKHPVPFVKPGKQKQLFFLNFSIDGGPNINGHRFVKPTSAIQTNPGPSATIPCRPNTSKDTDCSCTHMLKFELGNVIEMVLFSFGGTIKIVHPVHLHGHHFHVLKIAYPPFDPESGNSTAFNPDIRCLNEQCTRATWADPSWINGNIPGLNLINPPHKDTINVPANGYVIIRFIADNPGYWLMHCHLAHHQSDGMNLVMQEGEIQEMAPLLPNFPTCNNFRVNPNQFLLSLKNQERMLLSKGLGSNFPTGSTFEEPGIVAQTSTNKYK